MKLKWFICIVLILSACKTNITPLPKPDETATVESETQQSEAATQTEDITSSDSPDLIFHNGQVLTIDNDMRIEEAIAVLDDLIIAVGSD